MTEFSLNVENLSAVQAKLLQENFRDLLNDDDRRKISKKATDSKIFDRHVVKAETKAKKQAIASIRERVVLDLPPELKELIREKSAKRDITMKAFIVEAITKHLES